MKTIKIILILLLAIFNCIWVSIWFIPGFLYGMARIGFGAGVEMAEESINYMEKKMDYYKSKKSK